MTVGVLTTGLKRVARVPAMERMSDRAHRELTSAIRDLRLKPGAPLSETELAAQLGVSRTPLREAISRLVDQKLLIVMAQIGTSVALIDLTAVEEASFVRGALESAAFTKVCADKVHDFSTLREILSRQERAVARADADAFFLSDENLHREIFRLSGRAGVWDIVWRSTLHLDRLRRLILPEVIATRTLLEEHVRIVDLLEAGDVELGVRLVVAHSRHVLDQAPRLRADYPEYFTP